MWARRGGVARLLVLLIVLAPLSLLPLSAAAQPTQANVSLQLSYEVLSTGFVRANITLGFHAGANASATLPPLQLHLPERFTDALPASTTAWSYEVRGPVPINVTVSPDLRLIAIAPEAKGLAPGGNESVLLTFFLRGAGGLLNASRGNISLALPLPWFSQPLRLSNFTLSLSLPSGVSVEGLNFTKSYQQRGTTYVNSTSSAILSAERIYNVALKLGSFAQLSLLRFPEVIRRVLINGTAMPYIEDTITIENLAGSTLTSLPLNLPADVSRVFLPAPPGPIPGSSASSSLSNGALDLSSLGRSVEPGSHETITLAYTSAEFLRATPWGFLLANATRIPVMGVVDDFSIALDLGWFSLPSSASFHALTPLAQASYGPLLLQPGLAAPASSLEGLWGLFIACLMALYLGWTRLMSEESPLARTKALLSLLSERAKIDGELLASLREAAQRQAEPSQMLALYSELSARREALARRIEGLRGELEASPETKAYRQALALERQEDKGFRELVSVLRRGSQGLVKGDAFRRELEAALRRAQRQLEELLQELRKVGPVGASG